MRMLFDAKSVLSYLPRDQIFKKCIQEIWREWIFSLQIQLNHYSDVIISAMASEITSITIVYSILYSGADQRKHRSSASLASVKGIHRSPVNSPHKGKCFYLKTSACPSWINGIESPPPLSSFEWNRDWITKIFQNSLTWDDLKFCLYNETKQNWEIRIWSSLKNLMNYNYMQSNISFQRISLVSIASSRL